MGKINLKEKLALFSDHWSPKIITEMNDYQIKLVKIKGDFVWHNHEDTDELFFVIEGKMKIEFNEIPIEHFERKKGIAGYGIKKLPEIIIRNTIGLIQIKLSKIK